ncbi:MAG: ATP-binding protein [Candidatus Handelsmanbacteria bacterium]|nr:ATP-binding protein [Candidatus Handelsmanbacteria bacterium]
MTKAPLLIIDELGSQALDRRDAHLLFKVISYRHERGGTMITSNKSIREWPEMLAGDEVLAYTEPVPGGGLEPAPWATPNPQRRCPACHAAF